MIIPNAATAIIEQQKVVGYLLNPSHPITAGKQHSLSRAAFPLPTGQRWCRLFATWCLAPTLPNA